MLFFKKAVAVLWFSLITVVTSNCSITLGCAEKEFYKNHQDMFAKNFLLENQTEKLFSTRQLLLEIAAFLVPASLSIMCTEMSAQSHDVSEDYYAHKIMSILIGGVVGLICLRFYVNRVKASSNVAVLKALFQDYGTNTHDDLKQYLPQDLVPVFDEMFKEYQEEGASYLSSDHAQLLFESIREMVAEKHLSSLDKKIIKLFLVMSCITLILIIFNMNALGDIQKGLGSFRKKLAYWQEQMCLDRGIKESHGLGLA